MGKQTIIDLSQPLRAGMPVFPGDPEVVFTPAGAIAPWRVTRLGLGTHSGTHIDAAAHYLPEGASIDMYPLERFVVRAWVAPVQAEAGEAIGWSRLAEALPEDLDGCAVLLHTGWDRFWGHDAAPRHPYLSEDAAAGLVARGASLVGTDALNVDGTEAGTTHAHAALLGADVLIVENLTGLDALAPGRPYTCAFVPLRLEGADGSPVRAYAFAGDAGARPPIHVRIRAVAARGRRRLARARLCVRGRRLKGPVNYSCEVRLNT
jgi:arylformamidase